MSVENYIEKRFNIILGHIREDNKKYQSQNYPEVLDEKKIKEELKTSLISDGPQTCLEYRDFQFKQKKIDDKKKNKSVPSNSKEIDDFDKFFEDEVSTMYNKSWSRLDKLMRKNKVKQMMAEGKPVVNGWLQIPSTVSAEVMEITTSLVGCESN